MRKKHLLSALLFCLAFVSLNAQNSGNGNGKPPRNQIDLTNNDNNIPVGCFDRYDFNSCEWGERDYINELLTRAMDQLGSFYEAQNYNIYYGVYKEFS